MSTIVAAISSSGRTISAPPFFTSSPGMPQTIAVDFGFRNGAAAALTQPFHRLGAVISHSGHHHADHLRGTEVFKCTGHHAFHARMPQILGFGRHRHRD